MSELSGGSDTPPPPPPPPEPPDSSDSPGGPPDTPAPPESDVGPDADGYDPMEKLDSVELDPVELDPVELDRADPVELDPVELDPVELDPVELDPVDPGPGDAATPPSTADEVSTTDTQPETTVPDSADADGYDPVGELDAPDPEPQPVEPEPIEAEPVAGTDPAHLEEPDPNAKIDAEPAADQSADPTDDAGPNQPVDPASGRTATATPDADGDSPEPDENAATAAGAGTDETYDPVGDLDAPDPDLPDIEPDPVDVDKVETEIADKLDPVDSADTTDASDSDPSRAADGRSPMPDLEAGDLESNRAELEPANVGTEGADPETPESNTPVDADLVCPANAEPLERLDDSARQDFAAYRDQLERQGATASVEGHGPAYDYQRRWCGDLEYRITADEDLPRAAVADGLNSELGLAQDAKYISAGDRSWYVPETLPPAMQKFAEQTLDKRLAKYAEVINNEDNPVQGLEIFTNSASAAQFIAGRMDALQVPGVVRIRQ